jgi:WD40 repeat protein
MELGLTGDEGMILVTGGGDGTVRVWNGDNGMCLTSVSLPSSSHAAITSLVWLSSQHVLAATATEQCAVYMWRLDIKEAITDVTLRPLQVWSTRSVPYALISPSFSSKSSTISTTTITTTTVTLWKLGSSPLVEAFSFDSNISHESLTLIDYINSNGSFSGLIL